MRTPQGLRWWWRLSIGSMLVTGALARTNARTADAGETNEPFHLIRRTMTVMGTLATFTVWTDDEARVEQALVPAYRALTSIEQLMTDWDRPRTPPSDVVRVNRAAGLHSVTVAPETIEVVNKALWIAGLSEGTFDITYAAMRGLWRFDETPIKRIPDRAAIEAKRRLINYRDVVVDTRANGIFLKRVGMRIGLGGIAKGYAVDRCAAVLREHGIKDFIVQVGGDLYASGTHGARPWTVGVQDPRGRHGTSIGALEVHDQAFSTAGDYERGFIRDHRRYHHIIDPRTGYPATASRSVSILASSAFLADALDDAVFILGPEKGLALVESQPEVGAVIVDQDNHVRLSRRLEGRFRLWRKPTPGE